MRGGYERKRKPEINLIRARPALTAWLPPIISCAFPSVRPQLNRYFLRRGGPGFIQDIRMANTTSAKKATRKIARRTAVNRSRRGRMRTFVRKVEEAIASGNAQAAATALAEAEPLIVRAAQKGIIHRNTAARKVSRLSHRVRALAK